MKKFAYVLTLCAVSMIGCDDSKSDSDYTSFDTTQMSDGSHGGHSHSHDEGPHGGKVIELADDHSFHGEVCKSEDGKSLTFYVLGGDLKTPVPADGIKFEVDKEDGEEEVLPSTAQPLEGESDDKSSVYSIDISSLGDVDLDHFHAHVHVTVDGKELEGGLAHDHGHADDDHGGHGDEGSADHGDKHEEGDKDQHPADDHEDHGKGGHGEKDDHDKTAGKDHDDDDHKEDGEKDDK